MDLLPAKAKPISNGHSASVILKKGKKKTAEKGQTREGSDTT